MKQKFFQLTWDWYDEGSHWTLFHENKTTEEFESDVDFLLKKYGKEYLDQESSWAGAASWTRYISDKMPELGYEVIQPHRYGHFGSYIIHHEEYSPIPEDDIKFKEKVGEELYNQASSKNKKIEDDMFLEYPEDLKELILLSREKRKEEFEKNNQE